jgi:hypothetical protein
MPFTPFIGLSVFVHLIVIGWNKLFPRTPIYSPHNPKRIYLGIWLFGCAIILLTFSFIFWSAIMLVRASIADSHSSVYVVEDAAVITSNYARVEIPLVMASPFMKHTAMPIAAFSFRTIAQRAEEEF